MSELKSLLELEPGKEYEFNGSLFKVENNILYYKDDSVSDWKREYGVHNVNEKQFKEIKPESEKLFEWAFQYKITEQWFIYPELMTEKDASQYVKEHNKKSTKANRRDYGGRMKFHKEVSTFLDGTDCRECLSLEKDVAYYKRRLEECEQLQAQCEKLAEALKCWNKIEWSFYADAECLASELYSDRGCIENCQLDTIGVLQEYEDFKKGEE